MSESCPTCGRPMEGADAMSFVRHTAEIAVPQFSNHEAIGVADPVEPPSAPVPASASCSWCGKPGDQVKKLLSCRGVNICNECVSLCYMVLRDELPDFA